MLVDRSAEPGETQIGGDEVNECSSHQVLNSTHHTEEAACGLDGQNSIAEPKPGQDLS